MARTRIAVPEGYIPDFDTKGLEQGEDGSLWVNLYVNPTKILPTFNKDGTNKQVRDISWSFSGTNNQWWNTYAALWGDKTGEVGDILAQLFPPADGKKFVRTRIMYDAAAVYCEESNSAQYPFKLCIDPKAQHIWLHRPWYEEEAKEQRKVWDELVGKQWVDLYTLQGNDSPAIYQQQQEPEKQELVPSGVTIGKDGLVDL